MTWLDKLQQDRLVIIDGGTGSALRRRGVPMSDAAWSGVAVHSHPDAVLAVHEEYIEAGAEVIITNTFATTRFLLAAAGLGRAFEAINERAVELAKQARDASGRDVAIAGSISNLPPNMDSSQYPAADVEQAGLHELAQLLAASGVDLIALEMIQDVVHGRRAMAAALATGLPVWLGLSCRRGPDGVLTGFDLPEVAFTRPLDALVELGPTVVNVMHSELSAVLPALELIRRRWDGPVGVYPEVGYRVRPGGRYDCDVTPAELVAHARTWIDRGVRLIGGCCGTTPDHIRALREAFA